MSEERGGSERRIISYLYLRDKNDTDSNVEKAGGTRGREESRHGRPFVIRDFLSLQVMERSGAEPHLTK